MLIYVNKTNMTHWGRLIGCGSGCGKTRSDALFWGPCTNRNQTAWHDPETHIHTSDETANQRPRWQRSPAKAEVSTGRGLLSHILRQNRSVFDLGVQQQVVWFDVSMNEAQLMDEVDGQNRLGHVELRLLLRQGVFLHQQRHHVTWKTDKSSTGSLIFHVLEHQEHNLTQRICTDSLKRISSSESVQWIIQKVLNERPKNKNIHLIFKMKWCKHEDTYESIKWRSSLHTPPGRNSMSK